MLNWLNENWLNKNIFFTGAVLLLLFTGCGFADLRQIAVTPFPAENNFVLPALDTEVSLAFDTEVYTADVERQFSVKSFSGSVEGELRWEGNRLFFKPRANWLPGTRYTLSLQGTVAAKDGREQQAALFVSFYALILAPAPALKSYQPAESQKTGVRPEDGGQLVLVFSEPMDRRSVEDAVSIEGISDQQFFWRGDYEIVVSGKETLKPWTVYAWTITEKAKSLQGVPLAKKYSGLWTTDSDTVFPQVARVFPVLYAQGRWLETGLPIETGLGAGQGIALDFNKDMNGDTVSRSLRFDPALAGRTEQLSPKRFVFIPERNPETGRIYTLLISADAEDSNGKTIGRDYILNFTPDIPPLTILSIAAQGVSALQLNGTALVSGSEHSLRVSPATRDIIIRIRFSLPFTTAEKMVAPFDIVFAPFFPTKLPPVQLRTAQWFSSDDTITFIWEGLECSEVNEPHIYRLLIPGGSGGITNDGNSYLTEDFILFIEAAS